MIDYTTVLMTVLTLIYAGLFAFVWFALHNWSATR